jgi:predicted SpoU family rRNA methylase
MITINIIPKWGTAYFLKLLKNFPMIFKLFQGTTKNHIQFNQWGAQTKNLKKKITDQAEVQIQKS